MIKVLQEVYESQNNRQKKEEKMFRQSSFLLSFAQQLTTKRFAGHSKWQNIKHDKAIKDQQRAKQFSKFARMIRIAIQEGGSTNPSVNTYLRTAIDQAMGCNMPMASINNQIKKFSANDAVLKRFVVEIKLMNKVFVICETFTDNIVTMKQNINAVLRKSNASYADVKHMFDEMGFLQVTKPTGSFTNASEFEEKLTEDAIEADVQEVEDVDFETKSATFICRPIDIEKVKRTLLNMGYTVEIAEHIYVPQNTFQLNEAEADNFEKFKQRMKLLDGIENMYDNVEPLATS